MTSEMKKFSKIVLFGLLISPLLASSQTKKDANQKPNIILIMADDLGWTDLSSPNTSLGYGSKYYESPNIDRLAQQGKSFAYAYTQQNCQPTRAALLSGQYATGAQNGVYNVGSLKRASKGVVTPIMPHNQNNYLQEDCVSMFETLKTAGYHTAWFGKFHAIKLGKQAESYMGVDYNVALHKETSATVNGVKVKNEFFAQNDDAKGWMFEIDNLKPYAQPYDAAYLQKVLEPIKNGNNPWLLEGTPKHLTDALGDAVVGYIKDRSKADSPFFAYIPFHAVHVSILPRLDLEAKYKAKKSLDPRHTQADYAAFVELLDQTVGRVLNALEDPNGDGNKADGIAENTMVIFYSDNGGFMGPTNNSPLRLRKGTYYEGGVRVPLIFKYPGVITPNSVNTTQEVHTIDFYPTLAEIAGAKLPSPKVQEMDGKSIASVLREESQVRDDKNELFWHFPGYMDVRNMPQSVIHYRHSDNQHYKLFYRYEDESFELYNLSNDLGETTNLLAENPSQQTLDLALKMNNKLRAWLIKNNAPTGIWAKNCEKVPYPKKDAVKKYIK
ncbi:arylsulfatase [Formosa agariphila KMM 3901]|uniref:Sulfatase n=2 Tax=Formosa TaxID=225842 RepID=PLH13_FORAG|nr:RecName: Full=Sulfatase; AltName: Full=Arylsulfatase; AltName: Full=Polysaccharide utilization locus H protein P13; Short=PUL H protein P13; AltName: Full=Sulfatase family S1 subfamily 16 protein P13; Short=P13_S1_16; Flags: Precursor [Formosa agariphila KMM 3901]CDF79914.1 arylsulfatase [Formosa agariphila KMM 3901]